METVISLGQTWEYSHTKIDSAKTESLTEIMGIYGKRRWELVSTTYINVTQEILLIFKRPY